MGKKLKISITVCIVLAITIIQTAIASFPFQGCNPYISKKITSFSEPWEYLDEEGNTTQTTLPKKLSLASDATEVSLFNTLPDYISEETVLKFSSGCQKVEIYIGDHLRLSFGSTDVSINDFPYVSGTHSMVVPLSQEDEGKKVELKLSVIPFYTWELRMVRGVEIGSHHQFLLNEMYQNGFLWVSCIVGILTSLFLLFLWGSVLIYRRKWYLPLQFAVASILWVLFASSDNSFLLAAFDYNPFFSVYTEIWFYVMDGLLPIISYYLLWACDSRIIEKKQMKCVFLHVGVYLTFALLHLGGILSINLIRPLLMMISMAMYTCLFLRMRKKKKLNNSLFVYAVFVIMSGYFLDYLKYILFLLPLEFDMNLPLYFNFPYMFFFNIAILIFSFLVICAVIWRGVYSHVKAEDEIRLTKLQIEMYQNKYDQMQEREIKMKRLRHDMMHHLRIIVTLFSTEDNVQAEQYLSDILRLVNSTQSKEFSKNNIMNITLGWFEEKAIKKGIRFSWACNIPFRELSCDAEICGVVSNILQNALEGCQRVQDQETFIDIRIKMQGNSIFIKASNSFDGILLKNRNIYVSRKAEEGHGYGIATIEGIARRFDGRCDITVKGNVFIIDVVLCGVDEKK